MKHWHIKVLFTLGVILFGVLVFADDKITAAQRAQGYAGLLRVLKQQSNLDKLLIIKGPAPGIKKFIEDASNYAKNTEQRIEAWRKNDASINAEKDGLPPIEEKTRSKIEGEMTKNMLLKGGKNFAGWLVLSQVQAHQYMQHTVEALHETETNLERKTQLEKDAKTLMELKDRAFELLLTSWKRFS